MEATFHYEDHSKVTIKYPSSVRGLTRKGHRPTHVYFSGIPTGITSDQARWLGYCNIATATTQAKPDFGWVAISTSPPPENKRVLLWRTDPSYPTIGVRKENKYSAHGSYIKISNYSHWSYIPSPNSK